MKIATYGMKTGEKASHSCCTATPGHLRDRSPIYYFLFQVARRIASSRHPSWSFPLHECASFLHASASSYRPVWDYLSALVASSPFLPAPFIPPIGPPGIGIGGRPGSVLGAFSGSCSWE